MNCTNKKNRTQKYFQRIKLKNKYIFNKFSEIKF